MTRFNEWKSEEELALAVVTWLQDLRWTVYQEVQLRMYDSIADIVAVNEAGLTWIIETKRSFGFKVLEQAKHWQGSANYVSVAVPMKRGGISNLEINVLEWLGIGCLYVYPTQGVQEEIAPHLQRRLRIQIKEFLTDAHKTFANAGNCRGSRYTPFQSTCDNVRVEVRKQPGITLKELLSKTTTHYSSTATARTCILKWGLKGAIKGVKITKEDRQWKLYPDEKRNSIEV